MYGGVIFGPVAFNHVVVAFIYVVDAFILRFFNRPCYEDVFGLVTSFSGITRLVMIHWLLWVGRIPAYTDKVTQE